MSEHGSPLSYQDDAKNQPHGQAPPFSGHPSPPGMPGEGIPTASEIRRIVREELLMFARALGLAPVLVMPGQMSEQALEDFKKAWNEAATKPAKIHPEVREG